MNAKIVPPTVALLLSMLPCCAQSSFVNLDFEAAAPFVPDVPPNQAGADVLSTDGVPGWTTYIGGVQVATIRHNAQALDAADIALFGPFFNPPAILQGSYSVFISSSSPLLPPATAAIAQTGQIPSAAKSLTLWLRPQAGQTIDITFAGNSIPISLIGTGSNYNIWGGDVAALAGMSGELRIFSRPNADAIIDNILFSATTIPEPRSVRLLATGAALLCLSRLRRRREAKAS
jgi:hypothetical protein